ncbi:MAG: hypothetical protein C0392_03025 [Syntrophus sp. (in: bacteria)]|nr:hypothetical protein [Syntrophus sp. (in: bacteria)]
MKKSIICFSVILFVVSFFSGCATYNKMFGGGSKEEAPRSKNETLNQAFYGFPDVPIPKELELVKNKSFVYETQTLKVGVLFFTGNVEIQSLEDYFKINMTRNGWKFVNSYKYRDITLNFVKEDKTANIRISKDTFSSDVEISIGPATSSMDKSDKGSMQKGNGPK